jgi:hypothetical protein
VRGCPGELNPAQSGLAEDGRKGSSCAELAAQAATISSPPVRDPSGGFELSRCAP